MATHGQMEKVRWAASRSLRAAATQLGRVLRGVVWVALMPVYGARWALRPVAEAVGESKAWSRWLARRSAWERSLERRIGEIWRRDTARQWRIARRWSQRAREGSHGGGRWGAGSTRGALAVGWVAAIARGGIAVAGLAVSLPFIVAVAVADVALKEMGLAGARAAVADFGRLPALGVGLLMELAVFRGPCGWAWSMASAAAMAAGIVSQGSPGAIPRSGRGPWGANAFVLSSRERHSRVRVDRRKSAGRVDGYELWLDPELARHAMDPAGWLGSLLGGFEEGPRNPWAAPLDQVSATAAEQGWGESDDRLRWVRWVEAMREAGALEAALDGGRIAEEREQIGTDTRRGGRL